ncbi:MAG: hypothetical protein LQ344_003508 [Seirophora lacunosa]|nr:MAG: hypothetical protein LQ344_003508 [Seirophora lacunosa]
MNQGMRANSVPVISSEGLSGDTALSCHSVHELTEKPGAKTPRSPGYVPQDYSVGRLEFQDSKRSTDELKSLARTSPPDRVVSQNPIGQHPMVGLSRTDTGRRRRILQPIGDSESRRSKPLKRLLYRLNKSATTSDLTPNDKSRESIEILSKQSSGGRKYMKIALNPKLYESEQLSTYKVNFQERKANHEGQKRIGRRSKTRINIETGTSGIPGRDSHLLDVTDDFSKKVKDEYPHLILGDGFSEPAVADISQTNNGYSPSKGNPKPELGPNIRESAAATLAIAQAHARTSGQVNISPERSGMQSRQHDSPVPTHGKSANRHTASSKGPHSVPIKFHLRPQRNSLPKTPRTSLDESSKLQDTSPMVNGKAKAISTISGTDSCADDVQSEIEPGEIMDAQREELIHGQGTFGYHTPASQKPPRSGPAPTRALPSLPETDDGSLPTAINMQSNGQLGATAQSAPSNSSQPKKSKSPSKGHRYRLSPIKNNIRTDASPTLALKPSQTLTDDFPQPPRSFAPACPDTSPDTSPARRNREVDISRVIAGLRVETHTCHDSSTSHEDDCHRVKTGGEGLDPSADPDKDDLYLPWQENRVERVKALRLRDMERLRSRQDSAIDSKSTEGENLSAQAQKSNNHKVAAPVYPTQSSVSLLENIEHLHLSTQLDPNNQRRRQSPPLHGHNNFSPIVIVAAQPPCPPSQPPLDATIDHTPVTRPSPARPSPISQPQLHPPSPHPSLNRAPTTSPFTVAGGHDPSSSSSRPHSYSSLDQSQAYTAELEARIAAMEKKSLLLERAFMAVIHATSSFGYSGANARVSGGSGCEGASWGSAPTQKNQE